MSTKTPSTPSKPENVLSERDKLVQIIAQKRMNTNESLGREGAIADAIIAAGYRPASQVAEEWVTTAGGHWECNCVPDLVPSHCHACSKKLGRQIVWAESALLHATTTPEPTGENK